MWNNFLALVKRKKEISALALIFLVFFTAAIVAVTSDRIITGIVLSYLSAAVLVLAFTGDWQEAKQFFILLVASVVLFVVMLFIYVSFFGAGSATGIMEFFRMVLFCLIVFLCPVCWVTGAAGGVMVFVQKRRKR